MITEHLFRINKIIAKSIKIIFISIKVIEQF